MNIKKIPNKIIKKLFKESFKNYSKILKNSLNDSKNNWNIKKLLKNDLLKNKPFYILIIFNLTISLALNF